MTDRDLVLHFVYRASIDAGDSDKKIAEAAAKNGVMLAELYLHGTDEEVADVIEELRRVMPERFPS